jgi:4-cresol dehydrogenase (hydroxylating)
MHIANDYKVLASTSQFPWAHGPTPLGPAGIETFRRARSIGCWSGSGGLYGTRTQVRDARAQLRRALSGKVDRLQFVDDRLLRYMGRFGRTFRMLTGWDVSETLKILAPVYNLLRGVPTDAPMASTHWRKKGAVPDRVDPDRDRCGLLWCSPVIPNTAAHVTEVVRLVTATLLHHGFEPQISISLVSERMCIGVIAISYDRDVQGEDARAEACYTEVTDALLALGYPPYRLNVGSMKYVDDQAEYAAVLRSLKAALDPNGILAPGRYEPGPVRPYAIEVPARSAVGS